jgi:DNA protecting protein DprA
MEWARPGHLLDGVAMYAYKYRRGPSGHAGGDDPPGLFPEPADVMAAPEEQHTARANDLMALSLVRGLGPAGLRALYDHFHPLSDTWSADAERLTAVLRLARAPNAEAVAAKIVEAAGETEETGCRALDRLARQGTTLLVHSHPDFPRRLLQLPHAPRWLFVQGRMDPLNRNAAVGVVGTRTPSRVGLAAARLLTTHIVGLGFIVVSGLAEGIDAIAHNQTVWLGGTTVAVLGNGFDIDFPASNRRLRQQILDTGGTLVSEYFPHQTYNRQTFVHRNRIIAGLSAAVIPVESRARSGTAHTVEFAERYGRRLIGVRDSGQPATVNEIADLLAGRGHPVLDLAAEDFRSCLADLLRPFASDARPPPVAVSEAARNARYAGVIRALADAIAGDPPDAATVDWLFGRLKDVIEAAGGKGNVG